MLNYLAALLGAAIVCAYQVVILLVVLPVAFILIVASSVTVNAIILFKSAVSAIVDVFKDISEQSGSMLYETVFHFFDGPLKAFDYIRRPVPEKNPSDSVHTNSNSNLCGLEE